METLISADPAFSAQILEESFLRWDSPEETTDNGASVLEAGFALRRAIVTWDAAAGPIGPQLIRRTANGKVPPLGVARSFAGLTYGWYRGTEAMPDVSELPPDVDFFGRTTTWALRVSGQWSDQPGWSWSWGLELLRNDLKRIIDARALPTDDDQLIEEALWLTALEVAGRRGSLASPPVSIGDVEAALAQFNPAAPVKLDDRLVAVRSLARCLQRMKDEGAPEIGSPWPTADQLSHRPTRMIWDLFSPEQQLQRARAVYGATIRAYENIVERWFTAIKPRMRVAATLPAMLRGTYAAAATEPGGQQNWTGPVFDWYLDPLPLGSESGVEISLGGEPGPRTWERRQEQMAQQHRRLVAMRPEDSGWLSAVHHMEAAGDLFKPAPLAPLVYSWLKADLASTHWS
jgi:hypothetical protein